MILLGVVAGCLSFWFLGKGFWLLDLLKLVVKDFFLLDFSI